MSEAGRSTHLIGPTELQSRLAGGDETVVLDVRHSMPTDRADPNAYEAAHVPGALFVDIDADLAGAGTGRNGQRPLPGPAEFEKTVRRWGIDSVTPVVVYGASRSPAPARAWWLLKWAGVESVRLLDGGWDGWHGDLASGAADEPRESKFVIRPGGLPVVEAADVPSFADRGLLLDARPAAKFSHPSDAEAGHVPGARSVPVAEFFDTAGFLLPDDQLRERVTALGIAAGDEPASYCGTGVAAALEVFVLSVLGVRARLYVGSASEWVADPSRVLVR
ncbi:thiosulfate/3-mercaptopyruvate sulfurtransferase [Mycolicibacterium iranicum]|uniref:Thiosulfate/3-mercaptopyruvate sulfurtransferase n=1 Tax=Mycolicibacterium iranicum TaxID=912594 RepID=A0A839Q942_MYCIR|nr:rhodanese-like domain-containing protein [Mycolicibacterium iranicum]MBB2989742.1 thiosulfate/3-mercaptopyruvate sulfurtransferase [Mycolicibacterium iranicum]